MQIEIPDESPGKTVNTLLDTLELLHGSNHATIKMATIIIFMIIFIIYTSTHLSLFFFLQRAPGPLGSKGLKRRKVLVKR